MKFTAHLLLDGEEVASAPASFFGVSLQATRLSSEVGIEFRDEAGNLAAAVMVHGGTVVAGNYVNCPWPPQLARS